MLTDTKALPSAEHRSTGSKVLPQVKSDYRELLATWRQLYENTAESTVHPAASRRMGVVLVQSSTWQRTRRRKGKGLMSPAWHGCDLTVPLKCDETRCRPSPKGLCCGAASHLRSPTVLDLTQHRNHQ